jgi:flagellar basal-body rod protein FlgC
MDVLTAMKISGSALKAERTRLNITAMNLANINTTRTMEGGPYRAKSVVFGARPLDREGSGGQNAAAANLRTVEVVEVVEDQTPFREVFDPAHPDANGDGMVLLPNVNLMEQMVDMMNAQRAYEANVAALDAVKSMAMRALDISR